MPEIRAEFGRRVEASELIEVAYRDGAAGRTFTTREMQGYDRELIEKMKLGRCSRTPPPAVKSPRHFILFRLTPVGTIQVARVLHDSGDLRLHLPDKYRT